MPGSHASVSILHVDDDPLFGELVSEYLSRHFGDLKLETVKSAEQGLAAIRKGSIECVVSDFQMPEVNGLEFLQAIREDFPYLPFILFTGRGSEEIASRAISAGVTDYIQKQSGTEQFEILAKRILNAVEQYRSRQELTERDAELGAVFEEAFDAMLIADDEGQYIKANSAAGELFGLDPQDLIGRRIEEFAPDDFDVAAAWQEFQTQGRDRGRFPLVRPDGSRRIVEYAATRDIVPGRHLSVLRDVTDHVRRQERLERQNERFNEFANVMSHDLKGPLNVASTWIGLAQEDHSVENLSEAKRALDRLAELIDDLAAVMRQGELVKDQQEIHLANLFRTTWETLAVEKAQLVVDTEMVICADRDATVRLSENLFRNALEHGGSAVTVRVESIPDGFAVEDDGPGIAPENLGRIFESGFTTKANGTGFGLVSCRQIAAAHGWEVNVTESSSGGARFEFTGLEVVQSEVAH